MSKKKRSKKTGSRGSPNQPVKKSKKPRPDPVPEPKPPMSPGGGSEALRLVLAAHAPPDGTPIDPTEEFRRQQAERLEIERLAQSYGFSLTTSDGYTPQHDQTRRAAEIAAKAEKPMSDGADTVRLRRRTLKITRPGGTSIEATEYEFEARNLLRQTIGNMHKIVTVPVKAAVKGVNGAFAITIKVGQWLEAKVSGKGEG